MQGDGTVLVCELPGSSPSCMMSIQITCSTKRLMQWGGYHIQWLRECISYARLCVMRGHQACTDEEPCNVQQFQQFMAVCDQCLAVPLLALIPVK